MLELAFTPLTAETRAQFEAHGWWTSTTWVDELRAWAADAAHDLAVIGDDGQPTTVGELLGQADSLARWLVARGVEPGDVVSLILPNWPEFLVVHAAIGLVGAVANPMMSTLGRADIGHVVASAEPRVVFVPAAHRGRAVLETVMDVVRDAQHRPLVVSVRGGGGDESFESVVAFEGDVPLPDGPDPRSFDVLLFTSGTESSPKGAVHTHQSTMFDLRAFADEHIAFGGPQCIFMPSPISHATGIQWGVRLALHLRCPLVLQDRWSPAAAHELVTAHQCTFMLAATPFISDLVELKRSSGDLWARTSFQLLASGGAPIPRKLVDDVREVFGCPLVSVFGATETFIATANHPLDSDADLMTDGRPLPHTEVAIVDHDGQPLPSGEEGEIIARGPHIFSGYLGEAAMTERAFYGEWYRFGDLGVLDDRGNLSVTGRIKDIVIRGGENISVREVEEALGRHPQVQEIAIVGYPDERLGERCCAFVIARDAAHPPNLEILTDFLRERGMATYKLPERLEILSEMPRTATGKQRKVALRELAARS